MAQPPEPRRPDPPAKQHAASHVRPDGAGTGALAQRPAPGQLKALAAGWGVDLPPERRPAYPKERHPPRLPAHAQRLPEQQPPSVEVLHSLERPTLTPLFGSSVPPRGLSGRLRRHAYGLSESDLRHWLLLLLADRVDMLEGLGEDLARGRLPHLVHELGWRAEWRHNRPALLRWLLLALALSALALALWQARRSARGAQLRRLPMGHAGARWRQP